MIDGITILKLWVNIHALLSNDRLTFGTRIDEQSGEILSPIRSTYDRGLTWWLIPYLRRQSYRVELRGSLHRFFNGGSHNHDQYTVNNVLLTLDELVKTYGVDVFNSVINGIEFGINLELPFPVSKVLNNLVSYKNQTFDRDCQSSVPYYVCQRQRYALKLYDKGKQHGLNRNLLRIEIRVRKMEYFKSTGVKLHTLADLVNVANYKPLGDLLVDAFDNIILDDPAIVLKNLSAHQRDLYQTCRNPRYWHSPLSLTPQQANTYNQKLSRNKDRFRAILDQHGSGWQQDMSTLVRQTWGQLTTVDKTLLGQINDYKIRWHNLVNSAIARENSDLSNQEAVDSSEATCHELTGVPATTEEKVSDTPSGVTCHELTDPSPADLSRINPLYWEVDRDRLASAPPPADESIVCPVTGVIISKPHPRQRFVSAPVLRQDEALLLRLTRRFKQYTKGSQEDIHSRVAHNVRNQESNKRNSLKRKITRRLSQQQGQLSLFPELPTIRLTNEQRDSLNFWQGTSYEVRL